MGALILLLFLLVGLSCCLDVPHHRPTNTSISFTYPEPRVKWNKKCNCGRKDAGRIFGGAVAIENEWPWQAALKLKNELFCGGSLINDRYVLTAAHCFEGVSLSEVTVHLAEHNLATPEGTKLVIRFVCWIISHPEYQSSTHENDIALLRLSKRVKVSRTVLPVCLPPPNPSYAHKMATTTGWGKTTIGSFPDQLKEVTIPVLSNVKCQNIGYGGAIKTTMLCAGTARKDSCRQGDSGGPLVFQDGGGNYDQIGIVSWGKGCGVDGYPGVYTRVNKFLSWIKANTADGKYCKGMLL